MTAGRPRISETVRDGKKRISYSESAKSIWSKAGIEVKFCAEDNNGPRHLAVPARIKNQNLTAGGHRISEMIRDGKKRISYSESAKST